MSYAGTLSGKKTELRRGLLLAAASVVVSLVVLEIVTRQLLPEPLPWLYPQVKYRSDPALFFALAPNQKAVTADKPASINARGLRGPLVPYARQSSDILRVLFLGDSIVFGFGVFEAEALPSRVGQLLAERGVRTEVINSGVPGYSTNQEVVFAEQEGVKYQPDWVVLGFCWNDISDKSGDRVSRSGALMAPGEKETDHRAVALLHSAWGHDLRNLIKRSRAAYGAMQGAQALRALFWPNTTSVIRADVLAGRDTQHVAEGWRSVGRSLHRLRELGQLHGFRPLVVAFPIPLALQKQFPLSSYPAKLREFAALEGLPFIELMPAYRAAYTDHESLFIPYDADHPNALGHEIAARAVANLVDAQEGSERLLARLTPDRRAPPAPVASTPPVQDFHTFAIL